jgi:hypothetical protein
VDKIYDVIRCKKKLFEEKLEKKGIIEIDRTE